MRKVLMIAYYFPPMDRIGVQRTLKFIKYLPHFLWQPIVLTTRHGECVFAQTVEKKNQIDNKYVYRTYELHRFYRLVTKYLHTNNANLGFESKNSKILQKSLFKSLRKFIDRWIAIPDWQIGWLITAVMKGISLMKEHNINLIYSTSSPETAHLIGYLIKKITHRPWVMDLRDGWIFESPKGILNENNFRYKLEKKLEGKCIKSANWIVTVTPSITQDIKERYQIKKVATIFNGFDVDELPSLNNFKKSNKFNITHTGAFSLSRSSRNPECFFCALKELLKEQKLKKELIEVNLVGKLSLKEQDAIRKYRLMNIVNCIGQVSRRESLYYQISADVFLLITSPNVQSVATGKLFEYLMMNKPILAIAHNNSASDIVSFLKAGICVSPNNIPAIKDAILKLYKKWEDNDLKITVDKEKLKLFEVRELTKKLSEVFDAVSNAG